MDYRYYADGVQKKNSYGINTPVYNGYFSYIGNDRRSKKVSNTSTNKRTINLTNQFPNVFVYSGFLNFNHKDIEEVNLLISDMYNKGAYSVLGCYNIRTGKYYVSFQQINKHLHEKHYFKARFYSVFNGGFSDFREFSELKLYGYAVGNSGQNQYTRQNILTYIIDNKIMTGREIISHLQGQISLRKKRRDKDFSTAISDWENDIDFVQDYIFKTKKLRKVKVA